MRAPAVIPIQKFSTKRVQVIETFDQRHPEKPLVFERFDHALGYRNAPVLAHGPEAMLDAPFAEQLFGRCALEGWVLVRDDVPGRAVSLERFLQRIAHPACVRAFQGGCRYDLARKVIDGHEDVRRPQAPAQHGSRVAGPNMIRKGRGDRAALVATGFRLAVWIGRCLRGLGSREDVC